MIVRGRGSRMPCESCAVQFSVFKRKRACTECERYYCSGCLRRGGGAMCAPCRVLSTRPLSRQTITHLKVRDLQCFLQRQNVSTRGCVEKEELVTLCITHVNSASYRRRGPRSGQNPFSTLKGLTTNLNDFINSAFDLRNNSNAAPPPGGGCFNSAHAHSPTTSPTSNGPSNVDGRFTTTPGGERDIRVPVPEPETAPPRSSSPGSAHVDTADCFEVEDLDDAGWEFVARPADPLPNGYYLSADIRVHNLPTAVPHCCYAARIDPQVEELDVAGWEFVMRPTDLLPNGYCLPAVTVGNVDHAGPGRPEVNRCYSTRLNGEVEDLDVAGWVFASRPTDPLLYYCLFERDIKVGNHDNSWNSVSRSGAPLPNELYFQRMDLEWDDDFDETSWEFVNHLTEPLSNGYYFSGIILALGINF